MLPASCVARSTWVLDAQPECARLNRRAAALWPLPPLRCAATPSLVCHVGIAGGPRRRRRVVAKGAWSETSLPKAAFARNNLSAADSSMKQEHSPLKCGMSVAGFWCTAQANA